MSGKKAVRSLSRFSIVLLGISAALLCGCDRRPRVTIEGGTVPLFKLTGRGSVQVISIDGPDFDNPNSLDAGSRYMKPFWQIAPQSDYDVARLEKSGGLLYGKIPEGFRQVFPENGTAPPPLLENELFTFDLRLANAGGIGVRFVIHNGKAVVEGS